MRVPPTLLALGLAASLPWAAGCGSAAGRDETSASGAPATPTRAASAFPGAAGGRLDDLRDGLPQGLRATPRSGSLRRGTSRVAFTLRDPVGTPLQLAHVAVYVARPDGTDVRGPFRASSEEVPSLPPGAQDGDRLTETTSEYVARVGVPRAGRVLVAPLVEVDGRLMAAAPYALRVR